MANESHAIPAAELRRVHEYVAQQGFALTNEQDIRLPVKCAKNLQRTYFDSGQLRHDKGDYPKDRERARDVILYEWNNGELTLEEYETIAIRDRSGIKGERIHKRIQLLQDGQFREVIETFLSLVPEDRRQTKGTFGINLFRTHTDVVTKPHRDQEEFIILYVLDRDGDGAESYLYENDGLGPGVPDSAEPLFQQQLSPGELMILEDSRFKHGATPLTPPAGGLAKRDVLICTVDYPGTYLERDLGFLLMAGGSGQVFSIGHVVFGFLPTAMSIYGAEFHPRDDLATDHLWRIGITSRTCGYSCGSSSSFF